ncbi:MAG: uncharacterized protein KVP18_002540 [Porospora cf. gigantea A]|uniref:uncharacterized protein n=1 Tax=Porospora cf. gigantea A TaxID=2853593 RepID=UPI0035594089|nr:MAG: hypothetical protein KVP18_002540 [Porospora cf. gigantea A]
MPPNRSEKEKKLLVKPKETAKPGKRIGLPVVKKKAKPKVKRRVLTPSVTNPYPPPLKNWKRPIRCLLNRHAEDCGVSFDVDANTIRHLAAFVEELLEDLGASRTNRAGFASIVTICKEFFPTLAGPGLETRGFLERLEAPDFHLPSGIGGSVLVKEEDLFGLVTTCSKLTDSEEDSSRFSENSCSEDMRRMLKDAKIHKSVTRNDKRYYQR